jgi:hypothetical protein
MIGFVGLNYLYQPPGRCWLSENINVLCKKVEKMIILHPVKII